MNPKTFALAMLVASPLHAAELAGTIPYGQFGNQVATDGHTVVVAAWGEDTYTGSAYVYSAAGLLPQGRLTAPLRAAYDFFGSAVAVEGDLIAVGAHQCGVISPGPGRVHLFRRGGGWAHSRILRAAGGDDLDCFGVSVAIDRGVVIVGAHLADDAAVGPVGRVFMFDARTGAAVGTLAGHAPWDFFGASLDTDNGYLVVGATGESAAYIYYAGSQLARLRDHRGDLFYGCDVGIDDGVVAVGSWGSVTRGAVHVYTKRSNWGREGSFYGGNPYDFYGYRLAVSRPRVFVGASGVGSTTDPDIGAVYSLSEGGRTVERHIGRYPGGRLGYAVDAADGVLVTGAPFANEWAGVVFVVTAVDND